VFRVALLAFVVVLAVAGCGGSSQKTFSADATKACLVSRGADIGALSPSDVVAATALGGAYVVHLGDSNFVTLSFGKADSDAEQLQIAYQRLALPNVKGNILDVLSRYHNAIMLWHVHPANADLALVAGCLK
jgi:hypothetical protein